MVLPSVPFPSLVRQEEGKIQRADYLSLLDTVLSRAFLRRRAPYGQPLDRQLQTGVGHFRGIDRSRYHWIDLNKQKQG